MEATLQSLKMFRPLRVLCRPFYSSTRKYILRFCFATQIFQPAAQLLKAKEAKREGGEKREAKGGR